jgi:hypothetical protein
MYEKNLAKQEKRMNIMNDTSEIFEFRRREIKTPCMKRDSEESQEHSSLK